MGFGTIISNTGGQGNLIRIVEPHGNFQSGDIVQFEGDANNLTIGSYYQYTNDGDGNISVIQPSLGKARGVMNQNSDGVSNIKYEKYPNQSGAPGNLDIVQDPQKWKISPPPPTYTSPCVLPIPANTIVEFAIIYRSLAGTLSPSSVDFVTVPS